MDRPAHRHPPAPHRRRRRDDGLAGRGGRAKRALKPVATPDDIDLIILATSTPNNTFPATAVDIQNRLGIHHGAAFDVQAVCSGYIYALTTADLYPWRHGASAFLSSARRPSRAFWTGNDRTTCVLFGDGAGAVVLEGIRRRGH
jgi:3-oxoacyl-[acyl-carrier-protein] synthase-3